MMDLYTGPRVGRVLIRTRTLTKAALALDPSVKVLDADIQDILQAVPDSVYRLESHMASDGPNIEPVITPDLATGCLVIKYYVNFDYKNTETIYGGSNGVNTRAS